ncbi:helix-turn-helix transcriptional regulator [Nocardioides sp. CER19]|uniref:AraC family transcriptional regulator n=1 Tax=Nocardioides sp. CER19 TaxID=3038538 RepID=UPI00244CA895|nr:helix-turn-helix transcriptional regulator [Nocardioides sp. CER19]MDH2413302.1 helix-turn-helix transcriptional regulator [Nocardioides sp. CER19]
MPVGRQSPRAVHLWPSGGVHEWPSGGVSGSQSHRRGHLVYAARGLLAVHTGQGTSIVPANRVAWTPAEITHRHRAHGDTEMRILFVSDALAPLLPSRPAVLAVSALAREALLTLTGPRSHDPAVREGHRDAQERLEHVLVDELGVAPERPLHLPAPSDSRLRALARLLDRDPGNSAPLSDLGRQVGASARTLSRLLSAELGVSFYEWRTQLRTYHALVLLAEGHDVTYVAHACGWSNASSFIAAFTSVMGTSPGRYRQAARAGGSARQKSLAVSADGERP